MTALITNFTGLVLVRLLFAFVQTRVSVSFVEVIYSPFCGPYFPGALFLLSSWSESAREAQRFRQTRLLRCLLKIGGSMTTSSHSTPRKSVLHSKRFVAHRTSFIIPGLTHNPMAQRGRTSNGLMDDLNTRAGSHDAEQGSLWSSVEGPY
jgi:hypothetical protein